ncbi:MAG: LysR family transcriptional regulator [Burkholderiaceae bacterium]|nr:LysR family transcriptional regulator [Burkholderiaceae bacterium]
MKHCDPNDMLLFAKAAELQGISAAARALGRPKASVSRAVVRLETVLNARLLERTSRKVALTDTGRIFLAHCQRVAEEVETAETEIGQLQGSVRGTLRVAVPMTFGRALLAPLLPRFLATYPELRLELRITDRAFDPVEDGLDVVVRQGPLSDSSLMSRELGRAYYGAYATPAYLAAHAPIDQPEDLAAHAVLDFFNGKERKVCSFARDGEQRDVTVLPRVDLNDAVMRRDAALQDIGIVLAPISICTEAVREGRLKRVLPQWQCLRSAAIFALWSGRRHVPPRLRAFLDFLSEAIPHVQQDPARDDLDSLLQR